MKFSRLTLARVASKPNSYHFLPPVNPKGEAAAALIKGAVSAVPFVGGMARVASKPNSYHLIAALTRLCGRNTTSGDLCKAEAIGLVVWHPATGTIDANWPPADSLLRIEKCSPQVEACYTYRFAGQPPHN